MAASAAEVTVEPAARAGGREGKRPSSGDSLRRLNTLPLQQSERWCWISKPKLVYLSVPSEAGDDRA